MFLEGIISASEGVCAFRGMVRKKAPRPQKMARPYLFRGVEAKELIYFHKLELDGLLILVNS